MLLRQRVERVEASKRVAEPDGGDAVDDFGPGPVLNVLADRLLDGPGLIANGLAGEGEQCLFLLLERFSAEVFDRRREVGSRKVVLLLKEGLGRGSTTAIEKRPTRRRIKMHSAVTLRPGCAPIDLTGAVRVQNRRQTYD